MSLLLLWLLLLLVYLATLGYQLRKPLPKGINRRTPERPAANPAFLADISFLDGQGRRQSRQQIFDEIFRLVRQARQLVVMDVFLLNDYQGADRQLHRPLSRELVDLLVERRRQIPGLRVLLITDPFNSLYGGLKTPLLDRLKAAGVQLVTTDLRPLRDSNPLWSGFWRLCCQWFGNSVRGGWLPNPVGPGKVTLRTYLHLLNFKANHRKTLVVDEEGQWTAVVTSANPHDASSAHDNVALRFSGPAALDLLETELAVARLSGTRTGELPALPPGVPLTTTGASVQVLTEGAIRDALLSAFEAAGPDDRLLVNVFFFSHRRLLRALITAGRRGARIRVLLDPNKDAFGRVKGGTPNRQSAWEMHRAGIPLRWVDTHGEQNHSKFCLLERARGPAELILGSANFTRRNLDNFNLETDVRLVAPAAHPAVTTARQSFEAQWNNRDPGDGRAIHLSLPYGAYADHRLGRYWRCRFMEASGWCIF